MSRRRPAVLLVALMRLAMTLASVGWLWLPPKATTATTTAMPITLTIASALVAVMEEASEATPPRVTTNRSKHSLL